MNDRDKIVGELLDEPSLRRGQAELRPRADGKDGVREITRAEHAAVIRAAPDAIIIIDRENAILVFNPAAEAMFGYAEAEAIGKDMSELIIPPPLRQRHRETLAHSLASGNGSRLRERLEMPATRADGTAFLCELSIAPIQSGGQPLFALFLRDITEQNVLQADHARLATILEFTLCAIISQTGDGIITRWNSGAEKLYGYSAQEMIGQSIARLFRPDHYQEYRKIMEKVQQGIAIPSYDTVRRRKDGTPVSVSVGISPIKQNRGEILEASAISHNISRQTDSEDQMRLLLESTGEGIYGIDLQGRCTFINRAASAMFGYAADEIIGREMHALIHHHKEDGSEYPLEECPISKAMQNRSGVRVNNEVLWRKNGTHFPAEYSSFPISRGAEIQGAVVTFQDVTQTRLLEGQYRQAQKMEAIGQLAGGVAHDFNNLLTIINGYSELLIEDLPAQSPKRMMLAEIHKAGQRSATLTRQLLAFSRRQVLTPRVLDMNAVVRDMEQMLVRVIGEDILLYSVLATHLDPVLADPGQMEQVLMNLVINARDAMPQGGNLTIETKNIELGEDYTHDHPEVQPGHYAMLAVTDSGVGMTEAVRRHLFEPFFTTKEFGKGTGLGLAVVHGIVKQSGGSIEVYSEPGLGTSFKIYLPRAEQSAPAGKSRLLRGPAPTGTETILLVEDDDAVRALTLRSLRLCGYVVLEASSGDEALRLVDQYHEPIHLLVTDVVMPGMSGRRVAEHLHTLHPNMKVLYASGYTDDAVIRHGILQEEVNFLQKPFSPIALAHKVREVLQQS